MFQVFRLGFLLSGMVFIFSGCAFLGEFSEEEVGVDRGYLADEEEEDCDESDCVDDTPKSVHGGTKKIRNHEMRDHDRVALAIQSRDIVLGMSAREVVTSWGVPMQRDVAGEGTLGHERWIYGTRNTLREPRIVYFENGKVAGWQ